EHARSGRRRPPRGRLAAQQRTAHRRRPGRCVVITRTWLRGLALHRPARLLGTAAGVAVGVALLAAIGTLLSATSAQMTERAVTQVPVDWQVQAQAGADPRALLRVVRGQSGVQRAAPVGFVRAAGLTASRGGTTQQTGAGEVLGLPAGYAQTFPGQ